MRSKNGSYSALAVSEQCLSICKERGRPISNLQLQKILYYVQAAFLVERDKLAFADDIVAWRYGPVIEASYYRYRGYVSSPITKVEAFNGIIDADADLIRDICTAKAKYTAMQLVALTHAEAPWLQTPQGEVIDTALIRDYFLRNPSRLRA